MLKPGNLICYNAGGMKNKTMGLVVDLEPIDHLRPVRHVLIMWIVVGEYMPKKSWNLDYNYRGFHDKIISGEMVWHDMGNWFEVTQ